MRTLAIGIAAALSLAAAAPVNAQGIWVGGPGFGVGVGFGPTYVYDAYPSYGYTNVGYWGEPAWEWGDTYAYRPVVGPYPLAADSFAYAPGVSVGFGYEPAYRYSTARYSYPERVTYQRSYAYSPGYRFSSERSFYPERTRYQRSYAYSPRPSTNRVVYQSDRRAGVRQHLAVGSRVGIGTERVNSRERIDVRGSRAMARGSGHEIERAGGKRDLR